MYGFLGTIICWLIIDYFVFDGKGLKLLKKGIESLKGLFK